MRANAVSTRVHRADATCQERSIRARVRVRVRGADAMPRASWAAEARGRLGQCLAWLLVEVACERAALQEGMTKWRWRAERKQHRADASNG